MTTPTIWSQTSANELLPQYFDPPKVNPAPGGLWAATLWTDQDPATMPPRWLTAGVQFRASVTGNYGGSESSGVWNAGWCAQLDDLTAEDVKDGARPADPAVFEPITTWASDACDLLEVSRPVTLARAQQVLRMREPVMVAREFAARLVADAPVPGRVAVADLTAAVGELEAMFAAANTVGVIHASPFLLPHLVSHVLVSRSGVGWVTASGHLVVVDGGYRPVLGDDLLIGTSPLLGWRVPVQLREAVDYEHNTLVAVAERSVVVGYEALVGAVTVAAP